MYELKKNYTLVMVAHNMQQAARVGCQAENIAKEVIFYREGKAVTAALYAFFNRSPETIVYTTGSTPVRTRLYRMGLSKFYDEIQNGFYFCGPIGNKLCVFEAGVEYEGFVAQRIFEQPAVMKTEIEKSIGELNKSKVLMAAINPSLNK